MPQNTIEWLQFLAVAMFFAYGIDLFVYF